MKFGRFLLALLLSLVIVVVAGGFFEYLAGQFNWFPGFRVITNPDGSTEAVTQHYFMLYPALAGAGTFLGSLLTWLFVAPGGTAQPARGRKPSQTASRVAGKSGSASSSADISGMPSFDFDKASKDIKDAGTKEKHS